MQKNETPIEYLVTLCIMKKAFLVYPHQLFKDIEKLHLCDNVFLIEDPLYFSQISFHKQKLILHRASMKEYEAYLQTHGITVTYIEHHSLKTSGDISHILTKSGVDTVEVYDVTDDWLSRRLEKSLRASNITLEIHESPMFLTSRGDLREFFDARTGKRKYFMNDFYIWQRKRLNVLVDNNKPVGGKWSFDTENRKKLPKQIDIPGTFRKNTSPAVKEATTYVEKYFSGNFGDTDMFWCPVTHRDAQKHLHNFLVERFSHFGTYEDAMTEKSVSVFHSTISPLLNSGLLTPDFVLKQVLAHMSEHKVPLAAAEGFIRQIIGWREFMRALYILEGRTIRTKNYFNARHPLPRSFWSGTTTIDPVDHHIDILRTYAYTHHIPRLMVLGNFMNLCHIQPEAVYTWFMEMYIDAYDWVMVPNVYSMALYADGGLLTTKPYIASSNYIRKMSDFKSGEWCETFDALFWNFVGIHYKKLEHEGRLGFIGVQYAKMPEEKKENYTKTAQSFLRDFYKKGKNGT